MSKYSRLEEKIIRLEQRINDLRVSNASHNRVSYEEYQRILHQTRRNVQGEMNTLKEEKQQMEDRIKRLLHMIESQADEISKLRARLNPEPPFVTISQMNLNDWRKEITKLEKIRHILKEDANDDNWSR